MKDFDAYEYVGVIAPGAVLAVALALQWPNAKASILSKDFSLGGFGVFLVCSFVLGHLVQAVGNLVESAVFWPFGGFPSNSVLKESSTLISSPQRLRLIEKVKTTFGNSLAFENLDRKAWHPIVRQIYASVAKADRSQRVDAFNRNYGLLRGIASAFILITIWFLITRWGDWQYSGTSAALAFLALYRMHRFATTYARELFVQYLDMA